MKVKKTLLFLVPALFALTLSSCISFEGIVMKSAADMLSAETGGASVFTEDDDPELISDALPLALKLYEMVAASNPGHAGIHYSTGKNFIMYANAFIQTPAGMLPDEDYLKQSEMTLRAKNMYLRGRDYILEALELNHKGFRDDIDSGRLDDAMAKVSAKSDAPMLYWAASGWIAAFACDPFDFEMANSLYIPTAMLLRALELDEGFNNGAIHDIFIQIYSSLPYSHVLKAVKKAPETVGAFYKKYYDTNVPPGTLDAKADFHFKRSIELSKGLNPGTYCSYASAVCVKKQDYSTYKTMLEKALAIDPQENPESELVTVIYQKKAAWMLEHADDFFITTEED